MMKTRDLGSKGFTIGELLLVFFIVIAIAGLLTPFIRYNQRRMDKITCANNLRKVGLALYIYARENDGRFPKSIKTLYSEQYLADESLMDCPGSKKQGTPEDPEYIYSNGLSVRNSSTEALFKDKPSNHPGGENILYVNGRVAWQEQPLAVKAD